MDADRSIEDGLRHRAICNAPSNGSLESHWVCPFWFDRDGCWRFSVACLTLAAWAFEGDGCIPNRTIIWLGHGEDLFIESLQIQGSAEIDWRPLELDWDASGGG